MPTVIVLDTTPLGLVTQKPGNSSEVDACLRWIADMTRAGSRIVVPEIADYEIRRELTRARKMIGLQRLDAFNAARQDRYLPITTEAMLRAVALWAQARNVGSATADNHALDGDVILVAQALGLGVPVGEIIVATSNVRHIARFIAADMWFNIRP